MFRILRAALSLCLLVGFSAVAQTDTVCPKSPNRVHVQVDPKVTFDSASRLYRYEYTLSSSPSSELEVEAFALFFSPPISQIQSPRGWSSAFFGDLSENPTRDPSILGWDASEHAPVDPNSEGPALLPPGLFQIKPGASLSGFSLLSPNPPGPVRYYTRGFMQLPGAEDEMEAEFLEACPPESVGDFFETSVMGATLGPVSFTPVQIDIKPGSTDNPINPNAQGVIPVAILSTKDFDAGTVDPASVTFGRGQAKEIHGTGHIEDVNSDGRPDMVLHFDTQQTKVKCTDMAVFLRGKTLTGQEIAARIPS